MNDKPNCKLNGHGFNSDGVCIYCFKDDGSIKKTADDDKCHLCGCVGFHYDSCPRWPRGRNHPELNDNYKCKDCPTSTPTDMGDLAPGNDNSIAKKQFKEIQPRQTSTDATLDTIEEMFADGHSASACNLIESLISSAVRKAQDAEILKACLYWEKYPTKPATYMIDRKEELNILEQVEKDIRG